MDKVPSSYDLEALMRDLKKVEEELGIFGKMVDDLKARREELLKIIAIVQAREELKEKERKLRELERGV